MPHHSKLIVRLHALPNVDLDRAQMPVEAVVIAAIPSVFHHDVPAVVGKSCHQVRVDDHPGGDRAHRIERFASLIALQRADVDSFMKTRVNNSGGRLDRIAHESILATFPGRRFYPFVVALNVLVELGPGVTIDRIVFRWEREV